MKETERVAASQDEKLYHRGSTAMFASNLYWVAHSSLVGSLLTAVRSPSITVPKNNGVLVHHDARHASARTVLCQLHQLEDRNKASMDQHML